MPPELPPTTEQNPELHLKEQELLLKIREQDRLDREIDLKEREFERGKYQSPTWIALIALCGTFLGAISTIIAAGMTGHFSLESQINNSVAAADLEQQKAEAQRFVEMMKIDFNKKKANEVVRFLVDSGFISGNDRNNKILSYASIYPEAAATGGPPTLTDLNFFADKDDPRNSAGSGGSYGKINGGKPFKIVNSYFQSIELSEHCKMLDEACQVYVASVADTQDIWRAYNLPHWSIDVGRPQNIGDLISRLNAYNAAHPENVMPGRSAAMMVIDGLAGSAKEEYVRLNSDSKRTPIR